MVWDYDFHAPWRNYRVSDWPKTVTLPSGKTATIREGKGRDLLQAQRLVGKDTDAMPYALIALRCQIDGAPIVYEDVLDVLSDADVLALMGEILPPAVPQQPALPASSTSGSAPLN